MKKYKTGDFENRPWGKWEVISDETYNPNSIVKRIIVSPKQRLSLQYHNFRNEHWFVSKGIIKATVGEETFKLSFGQTIHIPVGTKHRIENPSNEDAIIIEIQYGDILNENDIVRIQDDYNR